MLWRCLSIVRTLGGYGNSTVIKRASHSIDAYKYRRNLSRNRTTSQGNQGKLTRVDGGLASARDQVLSNTDKSNVNNVPTLHLTSSDVSAEPMSHLRLRNHNKTTTPVDILRTILSRKVTQSPKSYNSNALISLVTSVQAEGQLPKLSPGDISALISLLGTLSIYPATTHMYDNPLASRITTKSPRTYWPYITQIAQEKVRLGLGLTPSDHYWLMRVELSGVTHPDPGQPSDPGSLNKHDAMLRARQHYRFIRRHSTDPEVHGPYFEALYSLHTAKHLEMAVKSLCELLSWSYALHHPRLLAVLWHIVLAPVVELCTKSKQALLTTLTGRLHRHARALPQIRNNTDKPSVIAEIPVLGISNPSDVPFRDDRSIADLVNAFRAAIFSPLPSWKDEANYFANESYKWALSQALAALAPQRSLAERWNSLVLLAHCDPAPQGSIMQASTILQGNRNNEKADIVDWDVICILATMQKSFDHIGFASPLDRSLEQGIQGIGRTLWTAWLRDFRAGAKPRFVAQPVAASFFRLAFITKDVSLANAITCHCASSKLWNTEANVESETIQVASLATEYIGASLICGTHSLEHLLTELHSSFHSSLWPSVIQQIISNFSHRDVQTASKLYFLAKRTTDLSMDTSLSLAVLHSSRGSVDVALHLLRNHRLSQHHMQTLVDAVLLSLAKHRNTILHPNITNVLGGAMYTLYTISPPSPKHRPIIQHILPVLASSSYSARAGAIFRAIHTTSPSFFSKVFITRFLHLLIRHRQFRLVTQIVESLSHTNPRATAELQGIGLLGLSRGGASTLAMRVNMIRRNRDALVRMAHAVRFRVRAPSQVLSLKISSTTEYALDGPAAQFATLILVRAGRILAAKRLFHRTRGSLSSQVRTSLGNVILDGYIMRLSTRNGRHMRKVLAAYDALVREGEFIPDRITVNTLLKAILRWRNMVDGRQLRALFDHLVRNGYPGERPLGCRQVPFGTPLSFDQVFRLPRFDQPMSFERHIRPMLKMFIKAFHVRGDVAAARRVVGILKIEERARVWKRDKRRQTMRANREE